MDTKDKLLRKASKSNNDNENIAAYFETNELIINLKRGKTESMLFGTGKRLAKINKELEVIISWSTYQLRQRIQVSW